MQSQLSLSHSQNYFLEAGSDYSQGNPVSLLAAILQHVRLAGG
jgi:hypothetical protein